MTDRGRRPFASSPAPALSPPRTHTVTRAGAVVVGCGRVGGVRGRWCGRWRGGGRGSGRRVVGGVASVLRGAGCGGLRRAGRRWRRWWGRRLDGGEVVGVGPGRGSVAPGPAAAVAVAGDDGAALGGGEEPSAGAGFGDLAVGADGDEGRQAVAADPAGGAAGDPADPGQRAARPAGHVASGSGWSAVSGVPVAGRAVAACGGVQGGLVDGDDQVRVAAAAAAGGVGVGEVAAADVGQPVEPAPGRGAVVAGDQRVRRCRSRWRSRSGDLVGQPADGQRPVQGRGQGDPGPLVAAESRPCRPRRGPARAGRRASGWPPPARRPRPRRRPPRARSARPRRPGRRPRRAAITWACRPEIAPSASAALVLGSTPVRSTRAVRTSPVASAGVARVSIRNQAAAVSAPSLAWLPRASTSPIASSSTASSRARSRRTEPPGR